MRKNLVKIGGWLVQIACLLGGFGGFLQWLGVRPKDLALLQSATIPHVLWLLLAVALFATGIGTSVWSGFLQKRQIHRLMEIEQDHKTEVRNLVAERQTAIAILQGSLRHCEDAKNEALRKLEEVSSQPERPTADTTPIEVFYGDIQLIAAHPKNAFARETRQVLEMMGRGDDFALDTDVVVKMFIVNRSNDRQYIRDICASVTVAGTRVNLIRQDNFDAFELNGTLYEYCLDPDPDEPNLLLEHRAQSLSPLASPLPIELEPRRPLDGWVRFLMKTVDYEKLETNSYEFSVQDSLGQLHSITHPSDKKVRGAVTVRRKSGQ